MGSEMCIRDRFDLFAVVLNIIIFLDSLVSGLSLADQVEVVHYKDKQSNAHNSAHNYQKEEDSFA